MLNIIICKKDIYLRKKFESIVKNEVSALNLNSEISLSTNNPKEVINYLSNNLYRSFIYFLGVELSSDINGFELGKIIRKHDAKGYIIFITSHTELSDLTFKYKIQALDYISKFDTNNLKISISECLLEANNNYKNCYIKEKNFIEITVTNKIIRFFYDDIQFFETTNVAHKLRLHTKTGHFEFYGKISRLEIDLPKFFKEPHRSYLINENNISLINKDTKSIRMVNGEICYATDKYLKELIKNGV